VSLEIHLEAKIESLRDALAGRDQVKLREALGGRDRVSLEMHMEVMIYRDWRSTWRWSIWRR